MKKYYVESNSIELRKIMNKKAYFFLCDLREMCQEDFEEEIKQVAKEIIKLTNQCYDNPTWDIDEKEINDFNTELSIGYDAPMGSSVKYHLIEFKSLWEEDTEKEKINCIKTISESDIIKYLTDIHAYYRIN